MHNQNHEALFAKWLENQLTETEQKQFEQLCLNDADFASRVQMANRLAVGAEHFNPMPLPEWDKAATFTHSEEPRWWQGSALPAFSMAMSMCAIVMVLAGARVEIGDGQIAFGVGHAPDQAEVAALVENRLTEYRDANQALFTQYVDALAKQQQSSSAQLTEYLLSSSRKERREDFAELVKFINEQRSDDQRFYARQINHLQQEIATLESGYSGAQTPLKLINE